MKRVNHVYEKLISDENIRYAIEEVNKTHRWVHSKPNKTVLWIEATIDDRVEELRQIIIDGFVPHKAKCKRRYDYSASKWREIHEPRLWPDQYVHHMVVQVLQPVMMRGMDYWCCGSIRGRGTSLGIRGIKKWMRQDHKNTKYCAELDIHHFYDSLKPEVVMARMKQLIKDKKMLDVIWRLVKDGIMIGAYFSQWFANTVLQPLDHMIREQLGVKHYLRYMDNLTLFGRNKKLLHKAVEEIAKFLKTLQLELKSNWQVFKTKARLVNALGYRFARDYVLMRKKNLLRMKRQLARTYKKIDKGMPIPFKTAASLLSRLGQLQHCNSRNIREKYVRKGLMKKLKNVVRETMRQRKEQREWMLNTCLEELHAKMQMAN